MRLLDSSWILIRVKNIFFNRIITVEDFIIPISCYPNSKNAPLHKINLCQNLMNVSKFEFHNKTIRVHDNELQYVVTVLGRVGALFYDISIFTISHKGRGPS